MPNISLHCPISLQALIYLHNILHYITYFLYVLPFSIFPQSMEDLLPGQPGLSVQPLAQEEHKTGLEPVLTQRPSILVLMIVLMPVTPMRLGIVTPIHAQVSTFYFAAITLCTPFDYITPFETLVTSNQGFNL